MYIYFLKKLAIKVGKIKNTTADIIKDMSNVIPIKILSALSLKVLLNHLSNLDSSTCSSKNDAE